MLRKRERKWFTRFTHTVLPPILELTVSWKKIWGIQRHISLEHREENLVTHVACLHRISLCPMSAIIIIVIVIIIIIGDFMD
jgi:hypothetical protein